MSDDALLAKMASAQDAAIAVDKARIFERGLAFDAYEESIYKLGFAAGMDYAVRLLKGEE